MFKHSYEYSNTAFAIIIAIIMIIIIVTIVIIIVVIIAVITVVVIVAIIITSQLINIKLFVFQRYTSNNAIQFSGLT